VAESDVELALALGVGIRRDGETAFHSSVSQRG
jgi:hypothetical protein